MENITLTNESVVEKVVTGRIILNRANLFCPKTLYDNSEPKYSAIVIIPKEDIETIKKIKTAINNAIEKGKHKLGENVDYSTLKLPLRNGDESSDDIMYSNSYFINASSLYKPGVVNHKNEDVLFADVHNGQFGRVSLSFHPFNIKGCKGISCRLHNVQLLKDRFDPRQYMSSPQDDFKE